MSKIKVILAAGIVAAALSATSASAVIATFAQFSAASSAANVRWVNNGVASNSSVTNTSTGSGGYFYTTSSATSRVPAPVLVNFAFLQPVISALGTVSANFFMNVAVTSTPATAAGAFRIQDIPSGSFSFTSTTALTVGGTTYAAGSNLLTGTFTSGAIFGTATSGSFSGNSSDGTLVYTSDFLTFGPGSRDYAMSLTSITPAIFRRSATTSLRTFRAVAGGSFSADPAPIVNAVPEPEMWGLMVVGFGLVGVQVRRRARQSAITA